MAEYDGSVLIETKFDTKNASSQMMALESRIVKAADKVEMLRAKMDALNNTRTPTSEYAEIQNQIAAAERKLGDLQARQERFLATGGKKGSTTYQRMQYDVRQLDSEIKIAKADLQDLVDSGQAFSTSNGTEEYTKLEQQLKYAENELVTLNRRHEELAAKQKKTSDGYKEIGKSAKSSLIKASKAANDSAKSLKNFGGLFKNILKYGFGIRSLYILANKIRSAIKDGFTDFYNYSTSFKKSVDGLKSSAQALKDSFAAAFAPLVELAIPYIQKVIDALTSLFNMISQFTALISGQKAYAKAVKKTAEASNSASKAANKQLSSLDKLNNISSQQDSGSGTDDASGAFEQVPIDTSVIDAFERFKEIALEIKDIFSQGFWDGLGDWESRAQSIQDSISSIKDSLSNIFTDPAVTGAAASWVSSLLYMLGSLAGSTASIGLTIATNLIGGLSLYLEQNQERIKSFIISMFDIKEDLNNLLSDLFQSIAYVFEAFASGDGQQLTANIIGIFADAFMGVTELTSKIFGDIAQIIIQPFADNKEGFRTALEGFLSVLADVTGTIKQGIDDTFDKLNEVYDEHFAPFFDSVASGLSDLTGEFLTFWNDNVQPILDKWAQKFDKLWKEHLQPLIDKLIELLGSLADALNELWTDVIQPLISWIISNVLPNLLPILDSLFETAVDVIGGIADTISGIIEVLQGIIDFIVGVFSGDWEKALTGIQEIITGVFDAIKGVITTVLAAVGGTVKTKLTTIGSVFRTIFTGISSFVTTAIAKIKTVISTGLTAIKNGWTSILTTIKTSTTNIFNGIWSAIKNTINKILSGVESMANGVIKGINSMISALNNLKFDVPDWVPSIGGKTFGLNIPKLNTISIPRLATGAVIPANKEFMAVLGDQTHGTNVEAPLDTIKQALAEVIADIQNNGGGKSGGDIVVQIDGREVFRATQKQAKDYYSKTGKPAFAQ